jgi:hypothetical protein
MFFCKKYYLVWREESNPRHRDFQSPTTMLNQRLQTLQASPKPHPGDVGRGGPIGRCMGARHGTHQGIPIPWSLCHNTMISIGSGGPARTRPFDQG